MTAQVVALLCSDADRTTCNTALAAYCGDDPTAQAMMIPCSASGQAPATHWGQWQWTNCDNASRLKDWPSGVLPTIGWTDQTIDWASYGLDETTALAHGALLYITATGCASQNNVYAEQALDAILVAHGLQRVT